MPLELALLGVLILFGAASAGGGGNSPLFIRLSTLRCGVGCSSSTSGGGEGLLSSTRVTVTGGSPRVLASPLRFTLTGVLTPLSFCFLVFLGLAAFYVAFIFMMPTLTTISARYRASEMVWVVHLVIIFFFLLVLQLEQASTRPITVGRVAGSTFIVRRTTAEKITGPFTIRRGVPFICFNCQARPFSGLEWG